MKTKSLVTPKQTCRRKMDAAVKAKVEKLFRRNREPTTVAANNPKGIADEPSESHHLNCSGNPTEPMQSNKSNADTNRLPVVLTIGHSTRTLAEFIGLLQAHDVSSVVDVRTVPRSRHNPQFNKISLPLALKKAGLGYVHVPGLGGLRHAKRDSLNVGWRNASFRGYADYMQTPEFEQSLEELIRLANQDRIALMCAEAVPWRCHRSLIADALLVRGIRTEDIMSPIRRTAHTLTSFAKVRGTTNTYPAEVSPDSQKKPAAKRSQSRSSKKPDSH